MPLGTVNKIFSGATKSPQYDTILALETVLGMTFYRDEDGPYVSSMREEAFHYTVQGSYTLKDYYALPDHLRAELIDGLFYYMSENCTFRSKSTSGERGDPVMYFLLHLMCFWTRMTERWYSLT